MMSVLASGSSGNSIYVETSSGGFLFDAGITGKKIKEHMKMIDRDPANLKGIFVSHEHRDHIMGVGVLARKYSIPVYANKKTWEAMNPIVGDIDTELCFEFPTGALHSVGETIVESFSVSHDAEEPMFFVIHTENKKISILTDTGYVSEKMKRTVENSDALVFECNHDVQLLRMGKYPWRLQQRILSDVGHISNEDAGLALNDIIGPKTKKIYMAHLSNDNNYQALARTTVEGILRQGGHKVGVSFLLNNTYRNQATKLVEI